MALTTARLAGMKTVSWINMLLGALVVATPFFVAVSVTGFWTAIIAGGVILLLAVYEEYAESTAKADTVTAPSIVNGLAGLWLAVYPFMVAEPVAFTAIVVVAGLIVLALEIFNLVSALQARRPGVA